VFTDRGRRRAAPGPPAPRRGRERPAGQADPGLEQLGVGVAEAAQVVGQRGPAGWGE